MSLQEIIIKCKTKEQAILFCKNKILEIKRSNYYPFEAEKYKKYIEILDTTTSSSDTP